MTDDREWVRAAARRFERPLLAYVRHFLHDGHRSQDVVQDAFLQLCKQPRADVEPRLAAWLFAVCRRRAIDVLRKENRMVALSDAAEPSANGTGPAAVETADAAAAVMRRLAGLPHPQQEAVRLKFLQQFSYREIAAVMGLSESHVGVLLHTALTTLRASFADRLPHTGGI